MDGSGLARLAGLPEHAVMVKVSGRVVWVWDCECCGWWNVAENAVKGQVCTGCLWVQDSKVSR